LEDRNLETAKRNPGPRSFERAACATIVVRAVAAPAPQQVARIARRRSAAVIKAADIKPE